MNIGDRVRSLDKRRKGLQSSFGTILHKRNRYRVVEWDNKVVNRAHVDKLEIIHNENESATGRSISGD